MRYYTKQADADSSIRIHYSDSGFYLSNVRGFIGSPCELIKDINTRLLIEREGNSLISELVARIEGRKKLTCK